MAYQEKAVGVGLRQVYVAHRDDDGTIEVPAGTLAGTAYPGVRAQKSRALTLSPAAAQLIIAAGDDRAFATFQEPPSDMPTAELRTQISDINLIAAMTGALEFGSGRQSQVMGQTDQVGNEPDLLIWGSQRSKEADPTLSTYLQEIWQTVVILNAKATFNPSSMEIGTIGEPSWAIAVSNSSRDVYGRTLTMALHGCLEAAFQHINTRYKFFLDAFVGDGVEDEFTLTQGTEVVRGDANSPIVAYVEGVDTAWDTVSVAGVVKFAAPIGNGSKLVVLYEYS